MSSPPPPQHRNSLGKEVMTTANECPGGKHPGALPGAAWGHGHPCPPQKGCTCQDGVLHAQLPGWGGTSWPLAQALLPSHHVAHTVPLLHAGSRVGRGQRFPFILVLCSLNKAQSPREEKRCPHSLFVAVRTLIELLLHSMG